MRMRTLLLAFVSIASAAATAQIARTWLDRQTGPADGPEAAAPVVTVEPARRLEILVADRTLPAGTLLTAEFLRWQPWPTDAETTNYYVKGRDDAEPLVGSVVRGGLAPGEPLVRGRVVHPGDRGFLAALLMPGMRAVSVAVNQTTGLSGLVLPGDRVDLVLTHTFEHRDEGSGLPRRAAETVLDDLRVLAIDQRTDGTDGAPQTAKTVTLEVTPKQAEILAVAGELGQLSLSLRSVAAVAGETGVEGGRRGPTLDAEVSGLLDPPSSRGVASNVAVIRGGQVQDVTFDGGTSR